MASEDETPEVPGHAEENVGGGEGQDSEIPVGVDALTDEQIAKAEEAGPADGGGEGGDDDALDVSALMDDSGDAGDDAAAGDDADAGGDDADAGDADADATPDDDVDGPDAAADKG